MIKDEAEMDRAEVCSKLMKCNKEFLVNYILYLDEWMSKYQDALDKACKELEELEKKYYYQSVTFKHCKSASEWRKEILEEVGL